MTVELVGPFSRYAVVVDGYEVPHLDAHPTNGGIVEFVVDGRYSLRVPVDLADEMAYFLAQVVAVAGGLNAHPNGREGEMAPLSPYHRLRNLDDVADGGHQT